MVYNFTHIGNYKLAIFMYDREKNFDTIKVR